MSRCEVLHRLALHLAANSCALLLIRYHWRRNGMAIISQCCFCRVAALYAV